jgi:4-amino-4-deoxy-L-arabinose transferase-like glycosyltransferase
MKASMPRATLWALLAICAFGFIVRVWDLGEQSLWIDEGYTINASLSVLEKGYPELDSGSLYKNGPLSVYASALAMKVLPYDPYSPWAARLPSALAGVALVALAFFAVRAVAGSDRAALAASAIIALSQWEVAWSRQARGYMLLSCFVVASFLFLSRYLDGSRSKDLALSFLLLVGAYLSHSIAIVFFPATLLLVVLRRLGKSDAFSTSVAALAAIAALAALSSTLPLDTSLFKLNYFRIIDASIGLPIIAGAIGLIVALFNRQMSDKVARLGVMAIVPAASIVLFSPVVQARYLLPVFPIFLMLVAIGASRNKAVLAVFFACALPVLVLWPRAEYRLERGSPQPDFKSSFAVIEALKEPGDAIISAYPQMHKVYLGEKGAWLAMSLTRKEGEIARKTVNGVDFYAGAPIVQGKSALEAFASSRRGFVIVDSMTETRLREEVRLIETDSRFKKVYESGEASDLSHISVYRF